MRLRELVELSLEARRVAILSDRKFYNEFAPQLICRDNPVDRPTAEIPKFVEACSRALCGFDTAAYAGPEWRPVLCALLGALQDGGLVDELPTNVRAIIGELNRIVGASPEQICSGPISALHTILLGRTQASSLSGGNDVEAEIRAAVLSAEFLDQLARIEAGAAIQSVAWGEFPTRPFR
ncbi:MAG TPA: hypothetical protein VEY69_01185, partial [Lautropia sp.]|nr:hypothetical protein [Lautropia sp.]